MLAAFLGGGGLGLWFYANNVFECEISPDKEGKDERGDGAQRQETGVLVKLDNPRDFGGRGHRGEGFLLG